ncbi:hypothetical protein Bca52824_016659 [Brassica carinata]|uniref:Uncharacterized protein n=1 Tax=Brassica carinata TaxID=52824 RepID=A0A8X7W4W1_BRACI|nr:hypothetical protein Bca52824_016659 [Brassica carinata]
MFLLKQSSAAAVLVSGDPSPVLYTSRVVFGSLPVSKTNSSQSFTMANLHKGLASSSSEKLNLVLPCTSHEASPIRYLCPLFILNSDIADSHACLFLQSLWSYGFHFLFYVSMVNIVVIEGVLRLNFQVKVAADKCIMAILCLIVIGVIAIIIVKIALFIIVLSCSSMVLS